VYTVYDVKRRSRVLVRTEKELLSLGFTPEEIITALCGVQVHGYVIRHDPRIGMIDGLSMSEISDVTGLPISTVKNIVRRALTRMKRTGQLRAFLEGIRGMRHVICSVEITE
jgi:hypothetical protein